MCGIFGIVCPEGESVDHAAASNALDTLVHRGPDQSGIFHQQNVFLGHRRLSILDLSEHGKQPLVSRDGMVAVTVNGEIYNYKELRKEIGSEQFSSQSDSEVILHGYLKWGIEKLLTIIEGMFAFVIYDKRRKIVIAARDRVGIKPLYYAHLNGYLIWGSELGAIKEYCRKFHTLEVDKTALYDFLTYLYIPSPKTLYTDVKKLEPATFLTYEIDALNLTRNKYWNLSVNDSTPSLEVAAEEVKDILLKSVSEQLVSDVDVGFFLSGGLDSSSVVATASKCGVRPKTYSIGFNDKDHDESKFADIVSKQFSTDHHLKIIDKTHAIRLDRFMEQMYVEPFADSSAWPTREVSQLARSESTVVLTGDGGDELFGGYRWYDAFHYWKEKQGLIKRYGSILNRNIVPRTNIGHQFQGKIGAGGRLVDLYTHTEPLELYSLLLGALPWPSRKKYRDLLEVDKEYDDQWYFRKYYQPELGNYKSLQFLDFHTYLHDDILTKVDRATMSVGLEARVPLLSTKLIEYCFSLSETVLYAEGNLKGLLKYTFKDSLPGSIIDRGKRGFSIPLKKWNSEVMSGARSFQEYMLDRYI